MLPGIKLDKILFLDIETVPMTSSYEGLDDRFRKLWERKAGFLAKSDEDTPKALFSRAGIYAEFGKIVCISAGYIKDDEFRLKSYYGNDEKELLSEFVDLLNKHFNSSSHQLCAHNGKEFDFPYLSRRMLINRISLPHILDLAGKKPWEVNHIDTMELWKFGDYKHFTSLDLLTALFNIPTPKDDIDGSEVADIYYKEKQLDRIVAYCQKDVVAVVQLLLSYLNLPLIKEEKILIK